MAFRHDEQDYRWPFAGHGGDGRHHQTVETPDENSLSLKDTLRELTVTIIGFVGVIILITAVVSYLHD